MTDSAFRIELALRTRQLAKAVLDISETPAIAGLQLAECTQQIKDIAGLLKKAGGQ